jgi:hypothetical protein
MAYEDNDLSNYNVDDYLEESHLFEDEPQSYDFGERIGSDTDSDTGNSAQTDDIAADDSIAGDTSTSAQSGDSSLEDGFHETLTDEAVGEQLDDPTLSDAAETDYLEGDSEEINQTA